MTELGHDQPADAAQDQAADILAEIGAKDELAKLDTDKPATEAKKTKPARKGKSSSEGAEPGHPTGGVGSPGLSHRAGDRRQDLCGRRHLSRGPAGPAS